MAWHRVSMLPVGVLSSRTWRGREDDGREALLREVPEGVTPSLNSSVIPGVVPLREVVFIDGRRYGVWDLVPSESLQDLVERVHETGGALPLGVLARIIIDAARTLVAITPNKPHGGLSDGTLLLTPQGQVLVMDFGCPRPGRFTAAGPPSFVNDVFALGAVLHATLTGFGGTYVDAIAEGLPLPPPSQLHDECTPALDDVVQRAIARTADQRQPDLELFADELEAVLGDQLAQRQQVAGFLARPVRPGPPVPDADPGPAPGLDEVPTGQHPVLAHKETLTDLPPIAKIPSGTQPGTPPADAFSKVGPGPDETGPMASIPLSTQPGAPNPALMSKPPPPETVPRASVPPRASAPPSKPPPPVPMDTQPRLVAPVLTKTADTTENEVPTGPRPVPMAASSSSVSHAKLEWAQGQARVSTPPLGVPATDAAELGDDEEDESTAVRPLPKLVNQGTAPVLQQVGGDEDDVEPAPSITDLKPAASGSRKLIAALLVVVAGVFGAIVWKLAANPERRIARVTPVLLVDDDAGTEEAPAAAGRDAGEPLADDLDGGEELDGGEDLDDADGGVEDEDGGVDEVEDAGATADAGVKKKPTKKKPPRRRRRR
ncbi:MAG: hypothetical protein JNJ54_10045 [Myxococcaceae bacterium]|nr:hypothetical protein [Myxococcaceae bacterium]